MSQKAKYNNVISVLGQDRTGIIAGITRVLAECGVNISDISQTILQDMFTMIMLVDTTDMTVGYDDLKTRLQAVGADLQVTVTVQHKDIFNAMQRI